jgi:hypothetical protein
VQQEVDVKTLFILLVLVIAASMLWKHGGREKLDQLSKGDVGGKAKKRVDLVLKGMRDDGGTLGIGLQTAVCQWDRGAGLITDLKELERALDRFNGWCGEKQLGNRKISGYDVLDAACEASGDPCVVSVRIEGARYKLKVPERARISWAP